MSEYRTVVITGASRGLGLATATHLYRQGWQVVAAMRSVDRGLDTLRAATGAGPDDPRLVGVKLDLLDRASVEAAGKAIVEAVGAPDVVVHNAGIAAVGTIEELPMDVWDAVLTTHLLGPVALTRALVPAMREAGRGRFVIISSQGGVRGMPAIGAYSAAKGAAERWGEALAQEIAPFGLGVSVVVTGTFDTEIITDAGAIDLRDLEGAYSRHHRTIDKRGRWAMGKLKADPRKFAAGLERAIGDTAPFSRTAVGLDAVMVMVGSRLSPAKVMHQGIRIAMGLPKQGALAPGAMPELDLGTRLFLWADQHLPKPVLDRLLALVTRVFPPKENA